MLFTFLIRSTDEPTQTASVLLAIHGLLLDSARPEALAVTVNHFDRRAWWTEEGLILDHPVAIQFGVHTQRLLDRLGRGDLPDSATKVLEAIAHAGAEVAVERCDLCSAIFPAGQASVRTVCACPSCSATRRYTLDNRESPFWRPS